MTYKPCPRCKRLIPAGSGYCTECKPIAEQQVAEAKERKRAFRSKRYNKAYNKHRNTQYTAFYHSVDWKRTSRFKLSQAGYRCEAHLDNGCAGIACEVHHKQPIQTPEGWERRLDWGNLEAVCTHCHNLRHPDRFRVRNESGIIDLRTLGGRSNSVKRDEEERTQDASSAAKTP